VDEVVAQVDEVAEQSAFSGVIRVDRPGEPVWERAYGLAHRGYGVPNTVDTRFAIASGGKTFTAVAVMSLIADGVLQLDTKVRAHLGDDLPLISADVTVEQLLAHRSGIGDYLDEDTDYDLTDYMMTRPVQELTDPETYLPELEGHPAKFAPGEQFSYCNGGYVVLALVAQRAAGEPYHDRVRRRVLAPAGLADTDFSRSDEPGPRTAMHYLEESGLRTNVFHLPVIGNGDGGIVTTAADVRAFWTALYDGRILPHEQVREMARARSPLPDDDRHYGLGLYLVPHGNAVQMVGADTGAAFKSMHDPDRDLTWTVLGNSTGAAWPVTRVLADAFTSAVADES
jgi:CubicO group peptidase (beta-lactamase class C family)